MARAEGLEPPAVGFGIRLGVFTEVRRGLSAPTRTAFRPLSRSLRFAGVHVRWYQRWYQTFGWGLHQSKTYPFATSLTK